DGLFPVQVGWSLDAGLRPDRADREDRADLCDGDVRGRAAEVARGLQELNRNCAALRGWAGTVPLAPLCARQITASGELLFSGALGRAAGSMGHATPARASGPGRRR